MRRNSAGYPTARYAILRAHYAGVVLRAQNCFVRGPKDCAGKVLRELVTCNRFDGVPIVFGIVNSASHHHGAEPRESPK